MITVDPNAPEPPFEQIRARFAEQIEDGTLPAGERLPTVRRLADDLGVAANTVARAYRELEQAHLIETRGRAGSFVAGAGVEREARAAAAAYAERVRALGMTADEAVGLVRRALEH
ncbi:DNA-binding transcriptional regulator YhcF, GntR family [Nocardioides terrae]|uniref:DNA-binding transcriptional regulator YhcF, GntR family n=1 Tax=Nocardioides terrae TaxID=574651 RepID=A0A1I1JUR8_9ACTN|nr:GntR family transcriptional regulator [Nocardioides terrae]SFC52266.1 DNA-binding transcriptional regulator YhcF, GntR family [Nocardioides terrae]